MHLLHYMQEVIMQEQEKNIHRKEAVLPRHKAKYLKFFFMLSISKSFLERVKM